MEEVNIEHLRSVLKDVVFRTQCKRINSSNHIRKMSSNLLAITVVIKTIKRPKKRSRINQRNKKADVYVLVRLKKKKKQ
jgi:hypothetical protein